MSVDVKELVGDLNKAFNEFREANDQRIKALEQKGSVDPVLQEKVDKANNAITDIESKIEEAKRENQERIDNLEADMKQKGLGANGRPSDVDMHNEAKQFFSTMYDKPVEDSQVDVETYKNYKQAFNYYLRRGDKSLNNDIKNSLSVGSDPDGGQWVPASTANRVITRLFETSPVRQLADVMTIGTDRLEIPKDVDEATSGGWVGETQSRSTTATPKVGLHEIPVHEQYAQPQTTQKMLDDAQFDIDGWLSNKIANILLRTENAGFVNGNGVMKPRGFLNYSSSATTSEDASRAWGKLQYVFTGKDGGFKAAGSGPADCLIQLQQKLKSQYRQGAVFTMNRFTKATIRTLKNSNDDYYLIPDLSGNGRDTLLGFPVVEFDDMPDIASKSFSVAFGNFGEGYQIVDRIGIRVLRDPFTNKPYVKFYTTKRVGGDVVNFDALKLLRFYTA